MFVAIFLLNIFIYVNQMYFLSLTATFYQLLIYTLQTSEASFIIHAAILIFFNYFISLALIIHFYDHLYIIQSHLLIQYMY